MFTRFALGALTCLALAFASVEAWGGVALESFGIEPSPPSPYVFNTIGPQGAPGAEAGPGATVAWPVTINLALFNTLPPTVQINFPDRASVTLTRMRSERRGGSGLLWTGRGGDCSGLFRMSPTGGGFKGALSCLNSAYGVDHLTGSSSLRLSRYDDAGTNEIADDFSPGLPPVVMPSGPTPNPPAVLDQTVDVLVLFNGNIAAPSFIYDFAQDVVDQIQTAMDNSTTTGQPVIAEIRLAGAAGISRTADNYPPGDLFALPTDPEAMALRDYWAADVVIYITTGNGGIQGIANIPELRGAPPPGPLFAPIAYAVSLANAAINPGDWVAAHEFAHTFGANHNADYPPVNQTPVEDYAFGHWARERFTDKPLGNRTLLAYVDQCRDAFPALPCPRLLNYSNPNITVGWFTTGSTVHDNARLIKGIAVPYNAQYRQSLGRIFANGFN